METKTLPAKKLDSLMADIATLISEMNQLESPHMQLHYATARKEYKELEETLYSKLAEVKHFRLMGKSFLKVTKATGGRPLYLEIVAVSDGRMTLDYVPFDFITTAGWYMAFSCCEPCTATEYQAAVDMALEKGAVVV